MHPIQHTEAFVVKSLPAGEANRRYWLFTKEFGLIVATAQGVRKAGAKLTAHLSDYTHVLVDLVKGKEVWRLTGAQVIHDPLKGKVRDPLARGYARSISAIDRFLVAEGPHEELFSHMIDCTRALGATNASFKAFDTLSLWRMLASLGYIAADQKDIWLLEVPFEEALLKIDEEAITRLSKDAAQAIKESHL